MLNGNILISGVRFVGYVLTGILRDNDGFIGREGAIASQFLWKADGVVLNNGALSNTLILTDAMVGKYITAHTDYVDASGTSEHPKSISFGPIDHIPTFTTTYSGPGSINNPQVGGTISDAVTDVDGIVGNKVTFLWQTIKNGVRTTLPITTSSLTLLPEYVGCTIWWSMTFTDGAYGQQTWSTNTSNVVV